MDGDGLDDIIIGAAGHDDAGNLAGAAYIVRGSSLGADAVIDLSTADYKFTGENPGDYAGATVADAGDVDGDGLGDILVGALNYSATYTDQGAAYIVLGKSLGSNRNISLEQADQKLIGEFTEQFLSLIHI